MRKIVKHSNLIGEVIESFKKYIRQRIDISDEQLEFILSYCSVKKVPKRGFLLRQGEPWTTYAFISKGCFRTYKTEGSGNIQIISFAIENWWVGDRESLVTGKSSRFNIDAIEDSEIVLISRDAFAAICEKVPVFEQVVTNDLNRRFKAFQLRVYAAVNYTAEEKYNKFLLNYPDFVLRVPQNMLASYLGMSAETLSRVRKSPSKK